MSLKTVRKISVALVFILIIIFVTVSLSSCVQSPGPNDKVNEVVKERAYFKVDGLTNNITIYKFEYNGHQYINFCTGGYDNQTIVHDPDCKCHKDNNTNNTLLDW